MIVLEKSAAIIDLFHLVFCNFSFRQSCLALRYEALLLRDEKASSDTRLEVSYHEWLTLAEQLFDNGFYSAATKVVNVQLPQLVTEMSSYY